MSDAIPCHFESSWCKKDPAPSLPGQLWARNYHALATRVGCLGSQPPWLGNSWEGSRKAPNEGWLRTRQQAEVCALGWKRGSPLLLLGTGLGSSEAAQWNRIWVLAFKALWDESKSLQQHHHQWGSFAATPAFHRTAKNQTFTPSFRGTGSNIDWRGNLVPTLNRTLADLSSVSEHGSSVSLVKS